jgi:hypothetical protein
MTKLSEEKGAQGARATAAGLNRSATKVQIISEQTCKSTTPARFELAPSERNSYRAVSSTDPFEAIALTTPPKRHEVWNSVLNTLMHNVVPIL